MHFLTCSAPVSLLIGARRHKQPGLPATMRSRALCPATAQAAGDPPWTHNNTLLTKNHHHHHQHNNSPCSTLRPLWVADSLHGNNHSQTKQTELHSVSGQGSMGGPQTKWSCKGTASWALLGPRYALETMLYTHMLTTALCATSRAGNSAIITVQAGQPGAPQVVVHPPSTQRLYNTANRCSMHRPTRSPLLLYGRLQGLAGISVTTPDPCTAALQDLKSCPLRTCGLSTGYCTHPVHCKTACVAADLSR
jgi:hypothetical protein